MFIQILKHTESGKEYKLDKAKDRWGCRECALDNDTQACLAAGDTCQDNDMIWTEILKVEKVD